MNSHQASHNENCVHAYYDYYGNLQAAAFEVFFELIPPYNQIILSLPFS